MWCVISPKHGLEVKKIPGPNFEIITKVKFVKLIENLHFEVIYQSQLLFRLYQSFQIESHRFCSDREIDTVFFTVLFFNMTSILTLQQRARCDQTPFIDTCLHPPPFHNLRAILLLFLPFYFSVTVFRKYTK